MERFELCLILHTFSLNLQAEFEEKFGGEKLNSEYDGMKMTKEEANLKKLLAALHPPENNHPADINNQRLMVITLRIFVNDFQEAIQNGQYDKILRYFGQALELIDCVQDKSSFNKRGSEQEFQTDEYFRILTFNIISLIKSGQVTD